jgi:hypothetical protein
MEYTEISRKHIGRGRNVNVAAIPAKRVVGFSPQTAGNDDNINLLSVTPKYKGITSHAIAPGEVGDVHCEGIVPVESDGTGAIAPGDRLTASAVADATLGRVKTAAPGAGANADLIGIAETNADATAGAIVMCRIQIGVMQGA